MVITSESANSSLIVCWIYMIRQKGQPVAQSPGDDHPPTLESVSMSTEAVASSMIMTDERLSSALAIAMSWRCPALKLWPPAETRVSSVTPMRPFVSTLVAELPLAMLDESAAVGVRRP